MFSGLMSLCRFSQLMQCHTASRTWRNSSCAMLGEEEGEKDGCCVAAAGSLGCRTFHLHCYPTIGGCVLRALDLALRMLSSWHCGSSLGWTQAATGTGQQTVLSSTTLFASSIPSLIYHSICFPLTSLTLLTSLLTCLQLSTLGLQCLGWQGKERWAKQGQVTQCAFPWEAKDIMPVLLEQMLR